MAQTFSREFYYVNYYIDNAAYAKNCINKLRPKMHCNGKCQLMKKIQEQEKKDQQNQERRLEYKIQVLSSSSSFAVFDGFNNISRSIFHPDTNTGSPIDRPSYIFHPPGQFA